MNSHLIAQIERDNHTRMQEAHMYSMDQQSADQVHIHQAHSAARLRSQSQRQQPSGHAETSKSLPSLPRRETLQEGTLLTQPQVQESEDDTVTQRDTATSDQAEEMLAKLSLANTTSSGLGDHEESSLREGESFRNK
jgi:hypothetical protein